MAWHGGRIWISTEDSSHLKLVEDVVKITDTMTQFTALEPPGPESAQPKEPPPSPFECYCPSWIPSRKRMGVSQVKESPVTLGGVLVLNPIANVSGRRHVFGSCLPGSLISWKHLSDQGATGREWKELLGQE